jgi:hypothetical protein
MCFSRCPRMPEPRVQHVRRLMLVHLLESCYKHQTFVPQFSFSALSDFQDDAKWLLQASRVPSVLSSLFASPRVQICRGVQCIITTWTLHGPYSSLVRLTGANARTQSLTQMRYQMATLISACMTGTWVGRYPLCHAIVTWGAPCTVDRCEPKRLCIHDRTSRLSDGAAEND